ncbi:MAG: hypothetical protein SWC40_11940 [Thermodesulfobacteriota bacterium]|nr:hypothetical protein [Thermodesulfobacteriota bacterium]
MAEIKSTLDLVMEKTRDLVLSREEREAMEREEQMKKVPAAVQRYMDGATGLERLLEELDDFPEHLKPEIRCVAKRCLLDALVPGEEGVRSGDALDALAEDREEPWREQLARLFEDYERSRREILPRIRAEHLEALAAEGIRGDAVVVRPERSSQWQAVQQEFSSRLEEIRAAWRAQLALD